MKGFIELTMTNNGGKLLVNITSISCVEEVAQQKSKLVLKEKIEIGKNVNITVILNQSYQEVVKLIADAQES